VESAPWSEQVAQWLVHRKKQYGFINLKWETKEGAYKNRFSKGNATPTIFCNPCVSFLVHLMKTLFKSE